MEGVDFVAEEVTVTGSRIRGEAAESSAPVVILSKTEIQEKGLASIGDLLQTFTAQSNAINTQANNGGGGSTRISLRFNDYLSGFFEVSCINRKSDQKPAPSPLFIFFEDDVTVSAEIQYNEYGRDLLDVRRRFVEASNRDFLQDLDTYRIVLGMEHEFQGL